MLVRKIHKGKWFQMDILKEDDVSADAITNCLKTTKNTLSVWHITKEEDINNAVLALISNQDHLETIDVVLLDEEFVNNSNIKLEENPGETPVVDLSPTHRDLADLTFNKIGLIKDHIIDSIRAGKIQRFTRVTLTKILKEAIDEGRLSKSDLKESVQKRV